MFDLDRALNSIGKKSFVDYFFDFKTSTNDDLLAKKLLSENKNATSFNAQKTRIYYAKLIFENNKEKEALKIIVSSSRLDKDTRDKALSLYRELGD